jgi:DNA recombination protein RmuC
VGSLERQVLPGARKFAELGVRPDREIEPLEPIDRLAREPQIRSEEEEHDLTAENVTNGNPDRVGAKNSK